MRKQLIQIGKDYTDGKGNVRRVLARGPEWVLYPHQTDLDCIHYEVIRKGLRGPNIPGQKLNCTATSFANWAKGGML